MKKHYVKLLAIALTCWLPFVAHALNRDQVAGEIVSVDSDAGQIQVRILESGNRDLAREGTTHTFDVNTDTNIEYELDRFVYGPYRYGDPDVGDINVGDTVILDFEQLDQRNKARTVRNQQTRNVAVADRVRRESLNARAVDQQAVQTTRRERLPDSASALPAITLTGLLFALLALTLRIYRNRRFHH